MAKVKLLDPSDPRRKLDRYELIGEIATGGMATVFLARRGGVGGFQRFVAIKRLHPHLANEPEFVEMFLDEARLAALIHHPNVVPILEVGESEAGYYLVMEYVEGDTLSRIVARTMSLGQMPPRHVILRMILDTLSGLHAAHELRDDRGQLLGLVHRDCSPQNVLVGVDGTARITDFGVARASARLTSTAHGKLKGKLAYMAPEQTRGDELDRRTDLFAMGIILWEVLCGKRLFKADSEAATLQRILVEPIRPPSEINPTIPKCFDDVVLKALDRNADKRYQTAGDVIDALEAAGKEAARNSVTDVGIASPREVASFVQTVLGQEIGAQRESVRAWLAQSDSGQQVVFSGLGSSPPRSPSKPATSDLSMDDLPETDIDLPARQPPSKPTAPVEMPRFEVAADVTMRFALEPARPAIPPPAAVSPPPKPESAAPSSEPASPPRLDPPRAPPPAKQSQRTLLGQGPAPAAVLAAAAASESAKNGAAKSNGSHGANGSNGSNGIPDVSAYTPNVDDDLEDLVTVARPANGPPASVMIPAVKTARGLFAEPLLAEARARIESNGHATSAPTKTPRMPQPADEVGVPEAKIALAASTMAMADPTAGAAIVEAVPIASLPIPVASGRAPRTLVSSTTEVSNGGFTPGSMTLSSSESALRHEVLDPTVIHTIPKRRYGKFFIVGIAFVLVFGTGILLLRDKLGLTSSPAEKKESKATATATSSAARVDSAKASATATTPPSASEEASAVELNASTDAVESASAKASAKVSHPVNNTGATTRGTRPSKSSSAAPPTTQTTPTNTPPTAPTEDLSNPYKF